MAEDIMVIVVFENIRLSITVLFLLNIYVHQTFALLAIRLRAPIHSNGRVHKM